MHRYENRFPEVGSPKEYSKREFNYKNICKYSVGILTDSECGKNQVYESYHTRHEKIHVLPYTISFDSLVFSCDHFKQKYSLPQKFLFYPAQFWKHKNHIRLINAIHSLIPQLKDLHIIFVGSPYNGYRDILSEIKQLNLEKHITLHSYVPQEDIPCFYRNARALVMPTFFGPTNIPPLEAIALGCPVAVSDIYGMRDQRDFVIKGVDPRHLCFDGVVRGTDFTRG
jgi:glycosyltransferase involved in cell wall biosynthesis